MTYASSTVDLRAQQIVEGLANPVYLTAPNGDPRLFAVEQPGQGDRLDVEQVGQGRLVAAFVAPEMGDRRPLGAGEADGARAPLEFAAGQPGAVVGQETKASLRVVHRG